MGGALVGVNRAGVDIGQRGVGKGVRQCGVCVSAVERDLQPTVTHVGLGDSATGRAREASRRGATVVVCVRASPKSQRHRDRTRTAIGREHRFPSTSILQSMQGLQAIFVSQSSPGPQKKKRFSDFPVFFVFFQSGRIPPKKPANPANPALFYTLKYIDYTCNERTERSRQHTARETHTHTRRARCAQLASSCTLVPLQTMHSLVL